MMLVFLSLLLTPLSAGCAALVVGIMHRDEQLEDETLLRHFLFMMVLVMVVAVAIGRTDTVRRRIDPPYRIARELDADPVIKAVEAYDPDTVAKLRGEVTARAEAGATLQAALRASRPLLFERITDRVGFADPKARVAWAEMVATSLEEIAPTRPEACWRVDVGAATGTEDDDASGPFAFSAESDREFMRAAVLVYESADRGMRHDYQPDVVRASSDEIQAAAMPLFERLESIYGSEIVRALHDVDRKPPADVAWSRLCAARRAELDAMLEESVPVAGGLVDNVVR